MDAEESAKHGAIRPEPSTLIVRQVPETPEEMREQMRVTDTSRSAGGRA